MWGNLLLFIVGDKLHFRLCVMFKSFSYKFEEGETRGAIRNIWCKLEGMYCFVKLCCVSGQLCWSRNRCSKICSQRYFRSTISLLYWINMSYFMIETYSKFHLESTIEKYDLSGLIEYILISFTFVITNMQ